MHLVMKKISFSNLYFRSKNLKIRWILLIGNNKSHYVYIKDFNRFMFHKAKN